jgi:uncharacterized protein (DUF1919 family)
MNKLAKDKIKTIPDVVRLSIIFSYKFEKNQNRPFTILTDEYRGAEIYVVINFQYLTTFVCLTF